MELKSIILLAFGCLGIRVIIVALTHLGMLPLNKAYLIAKIRLDSITSHANLMDLKVKPSDLDENFLRGREHDILDFIIVNRSNNVSLNIFRRK